MLTLPVLATVGILIFICVLLTLILIYLLNKKEKKQLDKIFIIIFGLLIFWLLCEIMQIYFVKKYGVNPIYFDYFSYISVIFLPVAVYFFSLIFARTKIAFKKRYILIFIIPVLSLMLLWTNDLHHLFYVTYNKDMSQAEYGQYFNIHYYYTYILYGISLFILLKYSIRNSGLFSKQAILILIGALVPIITSILMINGVVSISPYVTPIAFSVTIMCFAFAIFKFDLFKVTPIALQRIVDRISDSYIIIDETGLITDYNKTFITTFNIKNETNIRGKEYEKCFKENEIEINIAQDIKEVKENEKTISQKIYVENINKHFNLEITSIIEKTQFLGILVLFKDITQHIEDMQKIKDNQDILIEKERLATLGQMIGGVAHNLKTPIMSISGATEGLEDLVNEYKKSIQDPEVTINDHYEIAQDMMDWIKKIRSYDNYMSDIITAVKGQAVNMNEIQNQAFTIEELLSRVNILMRHELKAALVTINEEIKISKQTTIFGNVNSLVQVLNNLIANSIHSYGPADTIQQATATGSSFIKGDGANLGSANAIGQKITNVSTARTIDLVIDKSGNDIIISVIDYGCGMTEDVKNKLFKQMITTKGQNGSGLGLFMSYSTIKGNFQGDMNFVSELRKRNDI